MTKRVSSVIVLLLLTVSLAAAQDAAVISPALAAQLQTIEDDTARIRGLSELLPIPIEFPSRQDVIDYLERTYQAEIQPEDAFRETQFYIAFDLLPPGTDLLEVYLRFLTSPAGVAGFYDSDTQTMNVLLISGDELGDSLPIIEAITYAHEYTHALQDQHFDLDRLLPDTATVAENPDRSLAILSLVEGDATRVMTDYLTAVAEKNPIAALAVLAQGFQAGVFSTPEGTPPFIVTELTFPYEQGLVFVNELYAAGGWDAVDQAFTDLPQSTEQILHPNKYLSGERPIAVSLETTAPSDDWQLLIDRPLGEFYLRAYLRTQLPASEANPAAAGWGGDRYHLYHNAATGDNAWLLRIVWDSPKESAEFATAFTGFGSQRFSGAALDHACWSDADDALCFTGDETNTRVSYGPTVAIARALLGG